MLRLRPHHILDIVRNIGNERPMIPHEYGHLVHEITYQIMNNVHTECELVIENDDICGPCKMLTTDGHCIDVLRQLDEPVSKQEYNDHLDRRILTYLGIEPKTILRISDYLVLIRDHLDDMVDISTHPKEDVEYRRNGLKKGIQKLLPSL